MRRGLKSAASRAAGVGKSRTSAASPAAVGIDTSAREFDELAGELSRGPDRDLLAEDRAHRLLERIPAAGGAQARALFDELR